MVDTNTKSAKLKVFISYSRRDLKFVDQLLVVLEMQGFHAIIDRKGIRGAEEWQKRLGQLILDADIVVFVLSPSSATSDICHWEVDEALRRGKRIVPVVCHPLNDEQPHQHLGGLNHIYFYDHPDEPGSGFGSGLARLIDALSIDADWLREHTRLGELAERWIQSEKSQDLLLRGSELTNYASWRDLKPADAPDPTDAQRMFLSASEEVETARNNEERIRLEEMAAAQAQRAEALEAAETAQRDRTRATRRLLHSALLGTAIAVVLAALAGWQWLEADHQARLALEQRGEAETARLAAEVERKRANAQTVLAENHARELDQTLKFFSLIAISNETEWGPLREQVDIRFQVTRGRAKEGAPFRAGPGSCSEYQYDDTPEELEAEDGTVRVHHCDKVTIEISNKSESVVDLSVYYLSNLKVVSMNYPDRAHRVAPEESSSEFTLLVYLEKEDVEKHSPLERERLLFIAQRRNKDEASIPMEYSGNHSQERIADAFVAERVHEAVTRELKSAGAGPIDHLAMWHFDWSVAR